MLKSIHGKADYAIEFPNCAPRKIGREGQRNAPFPGALALHISWGFLHIILRRVKSGDIQIDQLDKQRGARVAEMTGVPNPVQSPGKEYGGERKKRSVFAQHVIHAFRTGRLTILGALPSSSFAVPFFELGEKSGEILGLVTRSWREYKSRALEAVATRADRNRPPSCSCMQLSLLDESRYPYQAAAMIPLCSRVHVTAYHVSLHNSQTLRCWDSLFSGVSGRYGGVAICSPLTVDEERMSFGLGF